MSISLQVSFSLLENLAQVRLSQFSLKFSKMSRIFLCVLVLFALAFADTTESSPTTLDPIEGTTIASSPTTSDATEGTTTASSPTTSDATEGTTTASSPTTSDATEGTTTASSPTTSDATEGTTTASSPTTSDATEGTTTASSPTTSDATEGTTTASSPTTPDVINSATTEKSPALPDKPSENAPSRIPSFQYFAVPFIPLNGLVHNFSGQYGVLPPVFGGMLNSVSQQTDSKQVEEPERETKIQPVIENPAPAPLPEFLQGINSMQELTEMVLREMLKQQRGDGTCGGFIELVDKKAEINHKFSWGPPPADVESCSWVIWAAGGGPIIVDFPKDNNTKFDASLSSLWVLNVNESLVYRKTMLEPGDTKTFPTNYGATKGYYPFVIVHMLVKQTQPGQRLHLKFYDQALGHWDWSRSPLRPTVKFLNETSTYGRRAAVTHPATRSSTYGDLERFFFMGQTPKGRRVSLGIDSSRLALADRYTWIQVSWIDMDSFQAQQLKIRGRSGPGFLRKQLKPSTSFVVVFCSHVSGNVGQGLSVHYEYY